jgi:hypothetical protein
MTQPVFVKKKPYPQGSAMPYIVRNIVNSKRVELIDRRTSFRIGIYPNEECANEARRFQLMREGYEV